MTNFKIDIQETYPPFAQKLKEKYTDKFFRSFGCLAAIVVIPLFLLFITFFALPKHYYDKWILKKKPKVSEEYDEVFEWTELFKSETLKIEQIEVDPEDEFDDDAWHGGLLIKFRTDPTINFFEDKYFQTETFIFKGDLFLFLVDKDIKIRTSKILQFDLLTFSSKTICELEDYYQPSFQIENDDTLKITCKRGDAKIELTLTEISGSNL
jgi:hypothetical protein